MQSIIKKYNNFVFISPHLDDAVWSCAGLMRNLTVLKKKVLVVTIFTKILSKNETKFGTRFVSACGFNSAEILFTARRKEDREALTMLGAKFLHLGFVDAPWRQHNHKYLFAGKLSSQDLKFMDEICCQLDCIFSKNDSRTLYFSPLGIGEHIDHVLIREAMKKMSLPTLFWEDYPYNCSSAIRKDYFKKYSDWQLRFKIKFTDDKVKAISYYKSQLKVFIEGRMQCLDEKYYSRS